MPKTWLSSIFFFFQAEDGIRDYKVTGVQTCALPILIVSEPSNPWMAGVAALFTREFFEAARARLRPDGLLCQWAHTYDIGADDLRSIVRTFVSVFPQGTMWLGGGGDLVLIGSAADAPPPIEPATAGQAPGGPAAGP